MFGPYEAVVESGVKRLRYCGNNVFQPVEDVQATQFTDHVCGDRLHRTVSDVHFRHLHTIDSLVFSATVEYFSMQHADWCNLPLTTLMISSPGEMYRGKKLDYTTDSLPIVIDWFDLPRKIFLSESSQFYLELRLLQQNVQKVFSIYNSFRKDKADFSHLAEFQHIEFEGKVDYEQNIQIAVGLLDFITKKILAGAHESLRYFLTEKEIHQLATSFEGGGIARVSFTDALKMLYDDTRNEVYSELSMEHFGSWEETRLTQLLGKHVIVEQFPLMQIPFYHNELKRDQNGIPLSESADIILSGFREAVGSGVRIKNYDALLAKAKIFNLPEDDYFSYLEMRKLDHYQKTAGFGLGWQRYTQWLLKLPYIWEATHTPRGHLLPKP